MNLLASIIAEKILADNAYNLKLDTISTISNRISEFKKEAVYEDWFKKEIDSQISISEQELIDLYKKFIEDREVEYVVEKNLPTDMRVDKIAQKFITGNVNKN